MREYFVSISYSVFSSGCAGIQFHIRIISSSHTRVVLVRTVHHEGACMGSLFASKENIFHLVCYITSQKQEFNFISGHIILAMSVDISLHRKAQGAVISPLMISTICGCLYFNLTFLAMKVHPWYLLQTSGQLVCAALYPLGTENMDRRKIGPSNQQPHSCHL